MFCHLSVSENGAFPPNGNVNEENMINGVYHMVTGKIDIPTKWECQLKIRNVNGNVIMMGM